MELILVMRMFVKMKTAWQNPMSSMQKNAIMKIVRSTYDSTGSELYVTHEPCLECASLIVLSEEFMDDDYLLYKKQ